MAFALIFVGILLTVSSVRGTQSQLFALIKSDFTGQGNFIYWTAVVLILGGIGYIPAFKALSRAMLVLIILALFLTKGNIGFFTQLQQAIYTTALPSSIGDGLPMTATGNYGATAVLPLIFGSSNSTGGN